MKFLVVCGLALLMSVAALFVAWMTDSRSVDAGKVREELSEEMGGQQIFAGPVVLVPYTEPNPGDAKNPVSHLVAVIAPATGSADIRVQVSERKRSLYRVPVFESQVNLESTFTESYLKAALPTAATPDWSAAKIAISVSSVAGALSDATLQTPKGPMPLHAISSPVSTTLYGRDGTQSPITWLGADATPLQALDGFSAKTELHYRGAQRITALPFAMATRVTMRGNWASPGFTGGMLPLKREVAKDGFAAEWFVPRTARGAAQVQAANSYGDLLQTAPVTSLVEVADAYQSVERALKYAPLFLAVVFLSYFLFEITAGKPVHVAQYVLVGIAQLVFYLLLLSFAERIGFDWSFLVGGGATVLLLSVNAGWVFASTREQWRALAIFTVLYAMIYGLLRLEDNALLVGALGSFATVALAMYLTRRVDWYGTGAMPPVSERVSEAPAAEVS